MMASIIGIGVPKVNTSGCFARLCKISKNHNVVPVAFIKRLAYQEPNNKPAPFPYWRKKYTMYQQIFDPMLYRFDENSKVLVVDGLPAIGKSKLCEQLADELGFLYMPPPTHEDFYTNPYGFNVKEIDSKISPSIRTFHLDQYLRDPNDIRVSYFQILYLLMRCEQYINGLLHILSTGQGIILNRSVYSDIAFMDAMFNAGYVSSKAHKYYAKLQKYLFEHILRPHLIIYLDVPVDVVKDKIKQRGRTDEVTSKIFTTQYLSDIDKSYKEVCLKQLATHSSLLVYDWTKEGNPMQIIEDIEDLNLDDYRNQKFSDWLFIDKDDVRSRRVLYDRKYTIFHRMDMDPLTDDFPEELNVSGEASAEYEDIVLQHPTERLDPEYNPALGKKVLFKSTKPIRAQWSLRRTPRDFVNRPKYMT